MCVCMCVHLHVCGRLESPRWDSAGVLVKRAAVTVIQNGVVLHNRHEFFGSTDGINGVPHKALGAYREPHPPEVVVELQEHHNTRSASETSGSGLSATTTTPDPAPGRVPSRERTHLDPGAFHRGLEPLFRELHALRALEERPSEGLAGHDVPQEELPLRLEGVVLGRVLGHLPPALEEPDRLLNVGIPDGPRRLRRGLRPAVAQARDGGPPGCRRRGA